MQLLDNILMGFAVAAEPQNLLYAFLGTVLGTLIGVLPGLGPAATIAILLPATYYLSPVTALLMLAGIYYGSQYGGSTTAILLKLPGESASIVTCIDGHEMARQGRAGAALSVAALGSFFAGCVSTFVIVLLGPLLTVVALKFGNAEYFALMVLGLVMAVALARGSVLKALAMAILGLILGTVGLEANSSVTRYTFGFVSLFDGLDFVIVAMAMFGFTEVINNLESPNASRVQSAKVGRLMLTFAEFKASWLPVVRGTVLGSVLGVLPGGGALLSSFASYSLEKRLARDPSRFGKGAIEGVAGPESANNAGTQTSFIPLLTLGIPGNAVIALMFGAMMIHGITPGPRIMTEQPQLFWGLIASMWIGNLFLVVLNLPLIGIWVRLLMAPYNLLFPAILLFASIGLFSLANNPDYIIAAAVFGLVGYVLHKLGCEPAPLLLGLILSPMIESNMGRALALARGDVTVFVTRPLSLAFLVAAAGLLILVILPSIRTKREVAFAE